MQRAYIEAELPIHEAIAAARRWAGNSATIHAADTSTVEHHEHRLENYGLPVTCASPKSRFHRPPHGTVIGVALSPRHVLQLERSPGVDGVIVLQAYGPTLYADNVITHAPWITAFAAERLGGKEIPRICEAPAPVKAAIAGLTSQAIANQGLINKGERSGVIQALTYLRSRGIPIVPDALLVEALRQRWGGTGPEEVHAIAVDLNNNKRLRYDNRRLNPERLREWASAT